MKLRERIFVLIFVVIYCFSTITTSFAFDEEVINYMEDIDALDEIGEATIEDEAEEESINEVEALNSNIDLDPKDYMTEDEYAMYTRDTLSDVPIIVSTYISNKTKAANAYEQQDSTRVYLYRNGDYCTSITGGWKVDWINGSNAFAEISYNSGTMMRVYSKNETSNNWSFSAVTTKKSIDLTDYTKIVYVFDNAAMATSGNGGFDFSISSTNTADHSAGWYGYYFKTPERAIEYTRDRAVDHIGEENIVTMDISDITGSRYVYISLSQGTGPANDVRIKEVYLVKETTSFANTSILEIDPNGGTYNGSTDVQTFSTSVAIGETPTMDIEIPVRSGYTFTGWTLDSYILQSGGGSGTGGIYVKNTSGGSLLYQSGDAANAFIPNTFSIYYQFTYSTKDVLTANWVANNYTLTINPNGGSWNDQTSTVTMGGANGTNTTIANPTRTGYTFTGWTKSGGGTLSGTSFTFGSSSTTLTANWTVNNYTLTLNPNSGTVNTTSYTLTYGASTNYNLSGNLPTRTGYTFKGWYTAMTNGTKVYANTGYVTNEGTYWKDNKNVYAGNYTLYAQWDANTNTKYVVKHWQQNVTGTASSHDTSNYTLADTQNLTGTTASSITPAVKTYTGFTSPSTQTTTIAADGSTVVNYYYTRKSYSIDVTTLLDGTENASGISGVTFDVYINGTKTSTGVKDFSNTNILYGSTYEIKNIQYPSYLTYDSSKSTNISGTITSNVVIKPYFTTNSYIVTYIDVVNSTSGTVLGTTAKSMTYGASVRGADLGSSASDNAYYNGYYYSSDTSATVTTSGATVYRIFKLRTLDKALKIVWNDNNNADALRPSTSTLILYSNGASSKTVSITSGTTSYTFSSLPKYDSNGKAITYTYGLTVNDRYSISVSGETITATYNAPTFSVTIPKTISMNGKTGEASGNITVNGTLYYNDTVSVTPSSSFTMKDSSNMKSMTVNVTQSVTSFTKNNLGSTSYKLTTSTKTFVGSWTGTFNYSIKLTKKN